MAKVLSWPEKAELFVFDIDRTLYSGPKGEEYIQDGTKGELWFLAEFLKCSIEDVQRILRGEREKLRINGSGIGSISHAVFSLGVDSITWNQIRCGCYRPEEFFESDSDLLQTLSLLPVRLATATNSPREIGERVVKSVGLGELVRSGKLRVFGPEDFGCAKPDCRVYQTVAKAMSVSPEFCVSFGDHEYKDCVMALKAGYGGAVVIQDTKDLVTFLQGGG